MELSGQLGLRHAIVFMLHISAALAGAQGQAVRAARLWGASEALREVLGITLAPVETYFYGPYIEAARTELDEAAWEAAWAEGRAMALEEVIEYALGKEEPATPPAPEEPAPGGPPDALTDREREVAVLISRGLTNRQISTELSISERTVHNHVRKILKKLGLRSRAQVATWVTERRLYTAGYQS